MSLQGFDAAIPAPNVPAVDVKVSQICEMWLLVNGDRHVPSIEGYREPGLVLFSQAEADEEAARQSDLYGIDCKAVKFAVQRSN